MGLLDSLLGGLMQGGMGGTQQRDSGMSGMGGMGGVGGAAIIGVVLQLLQQNGGLQGMLSKMQQSGLGDQAQSWIGTGQNQPISPDALSQVFGQGNVSQIAQQLGMSHQDAAGALAQALPQVVDRMTPDGSIPADHDDLVARTLEQLQRGR
jgi:uncharacterized protein YidB (DUF937 family)